MAPRREQPKEWLKRLRLVWVLQVKIYITWELQKLLGSSTWGIGELQDDWNDFLDKLKAKNLSGKTVAIFGCGDSASFGGSFCDAIGIIYNELQGSGCQFAGSVDTDGYSYDSSEACVDGQFVGLPLDESNESDQTDKRIDAWISGLKQVIC